MLLYISVDIIFLVPTAHISRFHEHVAQAGRKIKKAKAVPSTLLNAVEHINISVYILNAVEHISVYVNIIFL